MKKIVFCLIASMSVSYFFQSAGWAESKSLLLAAHDKQSADERAKLGHHLLVGLGVRMDPAGGLHIIKEAVERQSVFGKFLLAKEYFLGTNIPQNLETAKSLVQEIRKELLARAEADDAFAQYCLAFIYHTGMSGSKDMSQAINWYTRAANLGDPSAQNNLGGLVYGRNAPGSSEEAFKWFKKAADQGLAIAYTNLGDCYLYGRGVEENQALAKEWYQKALAQGLLKAEEKIQLTDSLIKHVEATVQEQVQYDWQGFFPPNQASAVSQFKLNGHCETSDPNCPVLITASHEKTSVSVRASHIKDLILSPRDTNESFDYLTIQVNDPGNWVVRIRNREDIYWQQNGKGSQLLTWKGYVPKEIDQIKNKGALQNTLCILDSPRFCVKDNWYHLELISETRGLKHVWLGVDNMPPVTRNLKTTETQLSGKTVTRLQFEIIDPVVYWGQDANAGIAAGLPDQLEHSELKISSAPGQLGRALPHTLTEHIELGHRFYRIEIDLPGSWRENEIHVQVLDAVGNEASYLLSGCNRFNENCDMNQPAIDEFGNWLD